MRPFAVWQESHMEEDINKVVGLLTEGGADRGAVDATRRYLSNVQETLRVQGSCLVQRLIPI